jgi:hypothetical protein
MCLKHNKYCIRMTFSSLVNDPESIQKSFKKYSKKPTKIHQKSVMVATKTESRKQCSKIYQKYRKMLKMTPQMGTHFRTHFGHLAPLGCPRRPWEPNWLPRPPPRAPGTSPSLDFHLFWDDFLICLMISHIMWATFCLVCLVSFLGCSIIFVGLLRALLFKFLATGSSF